MKRTALSAACAALALTLGATGASADDHGRWNHGNDRGHDRDHDRDRGHDRDWNHHRDWDHHRSAPSRTVVSFNYGYSYPGYFGYGYYAPQPVYYYPRYRPYYGPYYRNW